jgi:hypothetical protein
LGLGLIPEERSSTLSTDTIEANLKDYQKSNIKTDNSNKASLK